MNSAESLDKNCNEVLSAAIRENFENMDIPIALIPITDGNLPLKATILNPAFHNLFRSFSGDLEFRIQSFLEGIYQHQSQLGDLNCSHSYTEEHSNLEIKYGNSTVPFNSVARMALMNIPPRKMTA